VSYLDLVKQARARQSAALPAHSSTADAVLADELNELTKKLGAPPAAPTAALRAAYRRWFALTVAEVDGTPVAPADAEALHQQILRLTDDAGPLWADAVFADELHRFRWETARCGLCGGLGHPQEDA
jgi:hypothetical protein